MEGSDNRGRGGGWRRGGRGGHDSDGRGGEHRGRGRGSHHRGRGKRDHRGRGRGGGYHAAAADFPRRHHDEAEDPKEEDDGTAVFSRRKLESNWDRYEETERAQEADDMPSQRGTDFHVLLESAASFVLFIVFFYLHPHYSWTDLKPLPALTLPLGVSHFPETVSSPSVWIFTVCVISDRTTDDLSSSEIQTSGASGSCDWFSSVVCVCSAAYSSFYLRPFEVCNHFFFSNAGRLVMQLFSVKSYSEIKD
uniref:Uncharacterized protein n=1 Tax=Fundulus heteroclitus TaxID=8078 RepID=A0A3Q2T3J6_FUNHE